MPSSYSIDDKELGEVLIRERRGTSRFSARWKDGHLVVLTPIGVSRAETLRALNTMRPRLIARRPPAMFTPGQVLSLDGGITYHFELSRLHPDKILIHPSPDGGVVRIGSDIPLGTSATDAAISRLLLMSASNLAERHIIPRAQSLAATLKLKVRGWRITRGKRTLGTCSASRVISLSSLLIFLPADLRDYIIYHELAHLTEMNHSPRFHALCNAYCQGREAEFIGRLRTFSWPIIR